MSRTFSRDDTRRLAVVLAEVAQSVVMPRFRNLPPEAIRSKGSPHNLVTDADEEAERQIFARLARLHPGAVLIGEEASERNPALLNMLVDADLAFIVDPIDGTRNYVMGLPLFGMMIAACHRGEVIAGVIYDPVCRDAAIAVRGEGAWMAREDGAMTQLAVAKAAPLQDMECMIDSKSLPKDLRDMANSRLSAFARNTSLHCAAHEYRMAASGHCHVLLYNKLHPWDHAAGWLLHQEAGGYSAHFDGSPYKPTHRDGGLLIAPDKASWEEVRKLLLVDRRQGSRQAL
ncbi:MAG TPA: inositol monophosphatase family protein [Bordetella sp.]|uniref:inositol monophosphatase family protein n=1 Tax=Bordetella sp. TaxID=28081 RepID=UPI002ED5029D